MEETTSQGRDERPGSRFRFPTLVVAGMLVVSSALAWGWYVMIRMPGTSYQGPLHQLDPRGQSLVHEMQGYIRYLAGAIGERNVQRYQGLVEAEIFLESTLRSFGYNIRRQSFTVDGKRCANLEVEIQGAINPEAVVIIGAHYDSVAGSPGANDNASGVAALLALAHAFAGRETDRTLRFVAFVNEEPPYFRTSDMGSWVYARQSRERGERITAMMSLETMGYYRDEAGTQDYPFPLSHLYPDVGNFIAFVGNIQNRSLVRRVVDTIRQYTAFPSEGGAFFDFIPGVGWSDHWAFWREGYPGLMVTDTALFRYPAYHTAADTPDQVDYARLARVVSGLEQVIARLAGPSP